MRGKVLRLFDLRAAINVPWRPHCERTCGTGLAAGLPNLLLERPVLSSTLHVGGLDSMAKMMVLKILQMAAPFFL